MPSVNLTTQVGAREDLADLVVRADARNTPVKAMVRKGKKPMNVLYSWQMEGVPDVDTTPIPDGKPVDATEDMSGNRQRAYGRVQKARRVPSVTEMAEDIQVVAGIPSEYSRSKALATIVVSRTIEAIFCGDQDSSQTGQTNQVRGLNVWIQNGAQTDLPVHEDYRTPLASIYSGALASMEEDDLQNIMQSIYEQTGQMGNWDGCFGPDIVSRISTFTIHDDTVTATNAAVRTFFAKLEDDELRRKVNVIVGNFGTIRIHPTLWNGWNNTTKAANKKRGYILDMNDIEMGFNKLPSYKDLPFDDSGQKGVVSTIFGYKLGSPLKHGKIDAS